MIALAPPPVLATAAPAAQPAFRPPLGRPLAYTLVDEQRGAAGPRRFEARLTLSFDAVPDGFLLTLTTERAGRSGNSVFDGAMDAFAAIPLRYRLTAAGDLVDVVDADASWAAAAAAISDGVARAVRRNAAAPAAKALRAFRDGFAATPAAACRAALLANAQAIVGLPATDLPVGATRAWSGVGTDAAGAPAQLAGTLARLPDADGVARLRITAGGGSVTEETELSISLADGLLLSSRRTLRSGATDPPFFVETVTRAP